MPRRKRGTRRAKPAIKRRRYARRAKRRGRRIPNISNLMAKTQMMKMRFCESIQLTSTTGSMANVNYNAVSLWDPRVASSGTTVMGFQEMFNAFYNFGQVMSSKCSVTFLPDATTTSVPIACGVFAYDAVSTSLTGQGYSKWSVFKESNKCRIGFLNTNKSYTKSSANFKAKRDIGGKFLGELTYCNISNAGPTAGIWYFNIWSQPVDLSSTPAVVTAVITIDYVVRFTDRLPIVAP